MNKNEIVEAMAQRSGLNKKDCVNALEAFQEIVTEELAKGGYVQLVGFGTFEVYERAEHMGRNPATNEPMLIAATKIPKFKASKVLKNAVNT